MFTDTYDLTGKDQSDSVLTEWEGLGVKEVDITPLLSPTLLLSYPSSQSWTVYHSETKEPIRPLPGLVSLLH